MLSALLHNPQTWVFVAGFAFLAICVMLVPSDAGRNRRKDDDDDQPPMMFPPF